METLNKTITNMDETKDAFEIIDLPNDLPFEQVCDYIYLLNRDDANPGICYRYCGKILYPKIKFDAAWMLLKGVPSFKEEFDKRAETKEKFEEKIANRRKYMDDSDLANIERVKKMRELLPNGDQIEMANLVSGLKFYVENKDLPQSEFVDGLINRGCVFLAKDYEKLMRPYTADRFRDGDLSAGAYILLNVRDSKSFREMIYNNDMFTIDDDKSIYNFIRINGDPDYTKEKVEEKIKALKASKEGNNIIKKSL